MSEPIAELREHLAEVEDLRYASELLGWDQQTMMPPRGSEARAESLATLERFTHELFVGSRTEQLLDRAQQALNGDDPDSDDAALVRVTRRRYEKAARVPSRLAADMARAASVGQEAWVAARANGDFAAFAPYLERNLELARSYVDCFDGFACAYDALLDDYEPAARSSDVGALFAELRKALVPMIATLGEHAGAVDVGPLHGSFPIAAQREMVGGVLGLMGFDREGWRIDDAVHPFAAGIGGGDVRITSRWDEGYFASGLYGAMHECGHGLYEAGIAPALRRTPLGHGESLGMHESQSRMWENMVGRGRAFCGVLASRLGPLYGNGAAPDAETLFRAVNRVSPSFIRVEADEATYGLHVILRFELEQQLIEGRLPVSELPQAWNSRFHELLGLEVTNDSEGVLQDVHWSAGLIGYFPTYALGNLIAGSLWAQVHRELPNLGDTIVGGELSPLREWLLERVHRHGAKFSTEELMQRVVGGPIEVPPFVDYLKEKLGAVYGVAL